MTPLAAVLLWAGLAGAFTAKDWGPGTSVPASYDPTRDEVRGQSRDPVGVLRGVTAALIKHGGFANLPRGADGNPDPDGVPVFYRAAWSSVNYDCDEGALPGDNVLASNICGENYVIVAGYDAFSLATGCAQEDALGCTAGTRPDLPDALAFMVAHELAHLDARDPINITTRLTAAQAMQRCREWFEIWPITPDGKKALEAETGRVKNLPQAQRVEQMKLFIVGQCNAMLERERQARRQSAEHLARVRAAEDAADARAIQAITAFNKATKDPSERYQSFHPLGGTCAMRRLRDLEWATVGVGDVDPAHPDSLARARRLESMARGLSLP